MAAALGWPVDMFSESTRSSMNGSGPVLYSALNTQDDDYPADDSATAKSSTAAHDENEADDYDNAECDTAQYLPVPLSAADDKQYSTLDGKTGADCNESSVSMDVLDSDELPSCGDLSALSSLLSTGPFRVLLLLLLAWQTSVHTLLVRYSRGILHETYSTATALLCSEAVKLLFSFIFIAHAQSFSRPDIMRQLAHNVQYSLPMAVPALLFVAQSKLNYVALHYLDSSSYSILLQLKLLTTAGFAGVLLNKQLLGYQWRALLLLFVGVIVVQTRTNVSAAQSAAMSGSHSSECSESLLSGLCLGSVLQHQWGTLAAVLQATLSGLSGVYFEWKLKGDKAFTLWDRNMQLSMYGILFNLLSFLLSPSDFSALSRDSFFHGFSFPALSVVL